MLPFRTKMHIKLHSIFHYFTKIKRFMIHFVDKMSGNTNTVTLLMGVKNSYFPIWVEIWQYIARILMHMPDPMHQSGIIATILLIFLIFHKNKMHCALAVYVSCGLF